jgi:hypothetical protein
MTQQHAFDLARERPADAWTADEPAPPFPPIVGRRVALRPVEIGDYPLLRSMELSNELGVHWKYRGQILSPEQWNASLWTGVLAQFLVFSRTEDRPVGLVAVYKASFQDSHAYVSALGFQPGRHSPAMLLGVAVFLQYVFGCWDFDKLYFELPSYNLSQFASGLDRFFEIEGRLRGHYTYRGRKWDLLLLAMYRERWEAESRRVLAAEGVAQYPKVRVRMPARSAVPV